MAKIIAFTYELLENEKIGSGGGGNVYLAKHLRLGKNVVLKADKRELSTCEELLRREVDVLKDLSHPYIPQVYDYFVEDGIVYTVMDYIEGESIDKLLERGERCSQPQLVKWACQLLEALCYLHSPVHGKPPRGFVHSDIKPANLMHRPNDDICLIDFNIALALGEENVIGRSAGYASPEHYGLDFSSDGYAASSGSKIRKKQNASAAPGRKTEYTKTAVMLQSFGETGETAPTEKWMSADVPSASGAGGSVSSAGMKMIVPDVRSDVYSTGATLYHLLSGHRPARNAKEVTPLSTKEFNPQIVAIISKAMEPNPNLRYQTAEEMLEAFLHLWDNDIRMRRLKKQRMVVGIMSAAVCSAGIFLSFVGLRRMQSAEAALVMAEYSANALAEGNVPLAVEQALQAIPEGENFFEAPVTAEAQKALSDALGVYDFSDGFKSLDTIELPGAPFDISLSPKGKRLAAVYGYEAAIYDLESGKRLAVLPVQHSALSDCLFIDEDHVVYAGQNGVSLYDLAEQRNVWTGETATTLAVSADGSTVAAVDRDAEYAVVYAAADGSKIMECSFGGAHLAVAANDIFADPKNYIFALSEDGAYLAVSFFGGGLTIFDLRDGDDLILYDESEYSRFQGGFCGGYFAFAAGGNGAQFGLVDTERALLAGSMESGSDFLIRADEDGIFLGNGNVLVKLDTATLEEQELAYTGSVSMTGFATGEQYALVATEDNGFSFYDGGTHLMQTEYGNQNADFLALAGPYAVIGNRTETTLRVMRLESHADAQFAAYDARYRHEEARVSADGRTVMLFGYEGFCVCAMDGTPVAEVVLPDADKIYDQQFRREEGRSWLEVIWYDGTRRCYSAADGALISEETGEPPSKDLYEEFPVGDYRIVSGLHDAPVVYDAESGRELARLEEDGYLTYVTQMGDFLITEYIDADGARYGLVLDKQFRAVARLPGLCDVTEDALIFDYGSGSLRQSRLYQLSELVTMGKNNRTKEGRISDQ